MKVWNINDPKVPGDAVYIGRAGKGHDGRYGNPFRLGRHEPRGATLDRFKHWLWNNPEALRRTMELRDKDLVCFCKPAPCHGDVYVACLNALTDAQIDARIKELEQ